MNIGFVYLLESSRQGNSNKYIKRMIFLRITWEKQCKNTQSADFRADQIDVITNSDVITNYYKEGSLYMRYHCSYPVLH